MDGSFKLNVGSLGKAGNLKSRSGKVKVGRPGSSGSFGNTKPKGGGNGMDGSFRLNVGSLGSAGSLKAISGSSRVGRLGSSGSVGSLKDKEGKGNGSTGSGMRFLNWNMTWSHTLPFTVLTKNAMLCHL